MKNSAENQLVSVLERTSLFPPPIWLMRQAGRYLPEYREVRAKAGSFWAMCMNPDIAVEVTLQPIRRFGFDAAIVFSDILVVPFALGREIKIEEGSGPLLRPVNSVAGLQTDRDGWRQSLEPVYETLRCLRGALGSETALLGFAGGPWTLATYMTAGRGGDEQRAAKLWGYREPESFAALLNLIGDCVAQHLICQLDAGADAVQIFDSWAGGITESTFSQWVVTPTRKIVDKIRAAHPQAKIIGFPRASSLVGYERYALATGVDAVSVDTAAPQTWMRGFADVTVLQGNLDPLLLVAGGGAMERAANEILEAMIGKPFIFNLGHGVLPDTPPEHVADLVAAVRAAR